MRTTTLLSLILLVGFAAADEADPKTALRKEMKQLQGTWKVVSIVQSGKELPQESLGETVTFKDGTLTMKGRGEEEPETHQFRLDPSCTPRVIDIDESGKDFKDASSVIEGVYALDGETLKLCINV